MIKYHIMTNKQSLAALFQTRLRESFDVQDLNPTRFCRKHDIDRTTFTQLLTSDQHRLPRAETIVKIAQALEVSIDWLLGLSVHKERGEGILQSSIDIQKTCEEPSAEDIWLEWHREDPHQKVRHVPATLPVPLKGEEFFVAEYTPLIGADQARLEYRKIATFSFSQEYEICMPIQSLKDFVAGAFIYGDMDPAIRRQQLEHMAAETDRRYPRMRFYLYDVREIIVPPYTIFGGNRAVLYFDEKYIFFNAENYISFFQQEFDSLIRCAVVHPHEVSGALRDMAKAVPDNG